MGLKGYKVTEAKDIIGVVENLVDFELDLGVDISELILQAGQTNLRFPYIPMSSVEGLHRGAESEESDLDKLILDMKQGKILLKF